MSDDVKSAVPQGLERLPRKVLTDSRANRTIELEFHDKSLEYLTPPSLEHIKNRSRDFAHQVITEARRIEQTEHVGSGPPEITAAHIDEAWWVCRRRIRRTRHPVLLGFVRFAEAGGAAALSVGASNLRANWGMYLFITSTVFTMIMYLIEILMGRSD